MKLTHLGPAPDNLLAVFYDPTKVGCDEQTACRETNVCRLLGYGSCPAEFLRTERVISLAVEELPDGGTKVVSLIGGAGGLQVADYLPNFIGTHHKTGVGRELCDHAIHLHEALNGNSRPDSEAP